MQAIKEFHRQPVPLDITKLTESKELFKILEKNLKQILRQNVLMEM